MRVFISWSGPRSQAIADVLRGWLPSVLQAVQPYFSPDDIAKGSRWATDISKELDASKVGLLVITPENQEAPWLLFEAGALGKSLDLSKVCPLLFGDMEPTDVKGPLVQFQAATFSKEEIKKVLKMINGELGDAALSQDVLDNVFEMWWPQLEQQIRGALEDDFEDESEEHRSERDILEEVLALTRRLSTHREPRIDIEHPVWDDLIGSFGEMIRAIRLKRSDREIGRAIERIIRPLEYIMRRAAPRGSNITRRTRFLLKELEMEAASIGEIGSGEDEEDEEEINQEGTEDTEGSA